MRLKLQIYFLISVGRRPPQPAQIEPIAIELTATTRSRDCKSEARKARKARKQEKQEKQESKKQKAKQSKKQKARKQEKQEKQSKKVEGENGTKPSRRRKHGVYVSHPKVDIETVQLKSL